MKLRIGVTGPKKLANFGKDPEGEALLAAGKYAEYERRELAQAIAWMHTPHGSWLDETKIVYNIWAAKLFKAAKLAQKPAA